MPAHALESMRVLEYAGRGLTACARQQGQDAHDALLFGSEKFVRRCIGVGWTACTVQDVNRVRDS
eukprot:4775591-Pleurochrysis_carterae.AAC.1